MNGLDEFIATCSKVWDNIQNDTNLNNEIKKEFCDHMNTYVSGSIETHANMFFFSGKYPFIGPEVLVGDDVLGRLQSKDALEKRLRRLSTGATINGNRDLLNQIFNGNKDRRLAILKSWFGYNEITENPMWAFRNEHDKNNPYNNGVKSSDLPCMLGLQGSGSYYKLAYQLPGKKANQPTAMNAGMNKAWEPGGKTKPLCKNGLPSTCSKTHPSDGFPEVVHRPNTFNDVEQIEEL